MDLNTTEQDRYYKAKKRVEDIKGFYGNLISYIVVNGFFAFLNLKYSPEEIWFFWPMLGWGIGVFFHAMKVFRFMPFLGKDWEDKKIKELMEKENNQRKNWE